MSEDVAHPACSVNGTKYLRVIDRGHLSALQNYCFWGFNDISIISLYDNRGKIGHLATVYMYNIKNYSSGCLSLP